MKDTLFVILLPGENVSELARLDTPIVDAAGFCSALMEYFPSAGFVAGTEDRSSADASRLAGIMPVVAIPGYGGDIRAVEALSGTELAAHVRSSDRRLVVVIDLDQAPPPLPAILDAVQRLKDCEAEALFSVTESRDHPCQLKAYFNVEEIGMLHVVDPARQDGAMATTKPFFFDWPSALGREFVPGGLYERVHGHGKVSYRPASEGSDRTLSAALECVDATTARAVFSRPGGEKPLCVYLSPDLSIRVTATREPGGVAFHPVRPEGSEEKIMRICHGIDTQGSHLMELDIPLDGGVVYVRDCFDFDEVDAYSVVMLTMSHNRVYDIAENYPVDAGLWYTDVKSGKAVNARTGKVIAGRQDFPEVVSVDMRLTAFRISSLDRLEDVLGSGEALGYTIEEYVRAEPFDFSSVSRPWEADSPVRHRCKELP